MVRTPLAVEAEGEETDPAHTVTYVYDGRDLPTRVTVSELVTTRLEYDVCGRVSGRIEGYGSPEARGTVYAYDGLGRLASVTDPAGAVSRLERDALGRVTKARVYAEGRRFRRRRMRTTARGGFMSWRGCSRTIRGGWATARCGSSMRIAMRGRWWRRRWRET